MGVHGCARACAGMCAGVCVGLHWFTRVCVGVCVAGVSGFSNNYEFSEYLLETKVFMKWPLVCILYEFF